MALFGPSNNVVPNVVVHDVYLNVSYIAGGSHAGVWTANVHYYSERPEVKEEPVPGIVPDTDKDAAPGATKMGTVMVKRILRPGFIKSESVCVPYESGACPYSLVYAYLKTQNPAMEAV